MDLPAERSTSTSAPPIHPSLHEAVRSPRRRRPTGAAPPLPYRLRSSGIGWLVAAVALVGLTLAVFGRGLRGLAVAVTVIDDAVVGWLAGLVGPGLVRPLRGLARVGSWWVLYTLMYGLVLVLLVLRRWRHLLVWLVVAPLGSVIVRLVAMAARRPRPFGVELRPAGVAGDAVDAGRLPHRGPDGGAVHAGSEGPLAQHRQVAGDRADHGGRGGPDGVRGGSGCSTGLSPSPAGLAASSRPRSTRPL